MFPSHHRLAVAFLASLLVLNGFGVHAQEQSENIDSVATQHQRRKLTWDFFGFLMMMLNPECGPGSGIRIGDHPLCDRCTQWGDASACDDLCAKSSDPHKSSYVRFCDGEVTSDGQYVANSNNEDVSSFNGNTTPGGFSGGGSYAKGFQWWMLATAASVVMTIIAIHMGQRKDREDPNGTERSPMAGAVGRRLTAVSAFAEGIMPTKPRPQNVEMASSAAAIGGTAAAAGAYQLDDGSATAAMSDPVTDGYMEADTDDISQASRHYSVSEEGVEQSYIV